MKNFRHKGLENYWKNGNQAGLDARQIPRIKRILQLLDTAKTPNPLNIPGYYFHRLSGKSKDRFSMRVTGNYRITFAWSDTDAINIDLEDYH